LHDAPLRLNANKSLEERFSQTESLCEAILKDFITSELSVHEIYFVDSYILKITANENGINDILLTFR